jgi:phage baseplate assembly protein W
VPPSLDLIGRGWAFPLDVDARGGIAIVEGDEEIRQAILLIVRTRRGARVMRPEFGCRIWDLLFAPNDVTTWTLAGHHVREALGWWEPRITVEDVRGSADPDDPAILLVEVEYTIKATHDRRSLVFPFYLIPGEPENAATAAAAAAAATGGQAGGAIPAAIPATSSAVAATASATPVPPAPAAPAAAPKSARSSQEGSR